MASAPLAQVMSGNKDIKSLTENQAKSALAQATSKISSTKKAAAALKANGGAAVSMVLHSAESGGTLFLASMAEGFAISKGKSLKVGPVDIRAALAIPLQGWGIIDCLRGRGGGHQLAIGNGLMGSALASLGLQAGQALAEKQAGGKTEEAPAANPAQIPEDDGLTIAVTPSTQGAREVLLHPTAEGHPPRRHKRQKRLHR